MTPAKVLDVISRPPGCAGQVSDAVSAYTPVKMEDAEKLLGLPESECQAIWFCRPRSHRPNSWNEMQEPVVPLERNLFGHLLAGLLWERQTEKVLMDKLGLFIHAPRKGLVSLRLYKRFLKWEGKKNNLKPLWDKLMKQVDLEEPTPLLDQVYLGCTQRQCKPNFKIVKLSNNCSAVLSDPRLPRLVPTTSPFLDGHSCPRRGFRSIGWSC